VAVFNEILAARFARFAQKHFSMKGRAPVPSLSADFQLDMSLNNGVENRYLEGWDLFGRASSVAATAAQFDAVQLSNPVGSNVVAVVTSWAISSAVADALAVLQLVRNFTAQQANARAAQGWDLRSRPSSSVVLTDSSGGAIVAPGGTAVIVKEVSFPANSNLELVPPGLEIPLLPGTALEYVTGTVNQAVIASVWWRERALEESERT
jgi:hypothetical protein